MPASKDMPPLTSSFGSLFIKNQFRTTLPSPPADTNVRGKTAIITGSNTGLGFESAKQFLRLVLSHLIVGVRSLEKGKAAVAQMREETKSQAKIDVWIVDMESYQSIQDFALRCQAELPRIDIVILNAGLFPDRQLTQSPNGHEKSLQVNYLGTVLLTVLLLPVLRSKRIDGSVPRITVVNMVMATLAKLPELKDRPLLQTLDLGESWDAPNRYNVTKLLVQLFLAKLCDMVDPDEVVINMVEPGFTKGTDLSRGFTGVVGAMSSLFKKIAARPVELAATTYIDAAVVKGNYSHGCFLMNCEITP